MKKFIILGLLLSISILFSCGDNHDKKSKIPTSDIYLDNQLPYSLQVTFNYHDEKEDEKKDTSINISSSSSIITVIPQGECNIKIISESGEKIDSYEKKITTSKYIINPANLKKYRSYDQEYSVIPGFQTSEKSKYYEGKFIEITEKIDYWFVNPPSQVFISSHQSSVIKRVMEESLSSNLFD